MSQNKPHPDRGRRREIAKQALDASGFPGIDDDPYWLCNMHGQINTDDMKDMARRLREDAETLETAMEKIDDGELLPEEAALFIAERANFGDYDTHDHLYDGVPISER